jgi:hypothetical protein
LSDSKEKALHQGGYSREEQMEFRSIIFGNILQSALAIIRGMEMLAIDFGATSGQVSNPYYWFQKKIIQTFN